MKRERAVLCGDAPDGNLPFADAGPLRLSLVPGQTSNVNLNLDDIAKFMVRDVPDPFADLVEIATYVYCADQATKRTDDSNAFGEGWRRNFYFRIPVRRPDIWNSPGVRDQLCDTLGFLSDDVFQFDFVPMTVRPRFQRYLKFNDDGAPSTKLKFESVAMFSGGLDSFAGAIQEMLLEERGVVFVTHVSTSKRLPKAKALVKELRQRAPGIPVWHIPATINKDKRLSVEYTQRTRSFLYVALGATVAKMLGLSLIRFYENGVISFNLPISGQVVGARASRTTHPRVLHGFGQLLTTAMEEPFAVENPFLWHTKADVVRVLTGNGMADLVEHTTSCAHTWEITSFHTHCGACSQCIDRRLAVIGAGAAANDRPEAYTVNLFTDPRPEGEQRTLVTAYVETAQRMSKSSFSDFVARYPQVVKAVPYLGLPAEEGVKRAFELHRRHGAEVMRVVKDAIRDHADSILDGSLPPSCLVRLVSDSGPAPGDLAASSNQPIEDSGGQPRERQHEFLKRGKGWLVRFSGGEPNTLMPTLGAAYLRELLARPGAPMDVVELAVAVCRYPERYPPMEGTRRSDDDALSAYGARYEDLKQRLNEAREAGDREAEEKILDEMGWLANEIKRSQGKGGQPRKLGDDKERVRKKVQGAISRAIKEIREYGDSSLAAHLKQCISCGRHPAYAPIEPVDWAM
jgi:7-cyano-7-deazaguanine synthase in queuosine biosynthesis